MAKVKFALVGCGFIGQVHAANLMAHPETALTLAADIDAARAQQLAQRYGSQAVSAEQALRHDDIDAVLIASATPSHAALLEAAALAGKAVYCEKPIDLSLTRARQAVDKVLPLNVPVTVGFNRRFDHSHRQLKQQIKQGAIGQPELIQMVCRSSAMPPLDYLRHSGGQMRDQAVRGGCSSLKTMPSWRRTSSMVCSVNSEVASGRIGESVSAWPMHQAKCSASCASWL